MMHRSRRRVAAFAALGFLMSACSSTKTSTTVDSTQSSTGSAAAVTTKAGEGKPLDTVRTAFYNDMQVPDPDVFYEVEGNQVIMSTYEGLLRYKPGGTTEIEPLLAESYTVSIDGLTYTFKLRAGVKFVDGTPFNAEAAKFSFDRRNKVNNAPAYMLTDLETATASDPATFVVKLKKPVHAFLDYLASPYGPKMVSPALITANEKAGDSAQDWLRTHSAGTGPYAISDFTLGQRYILKAAPTYWGTKPSVGTIDIAIVPDASTQTLQLEGGDLDIVHGPPLATIEAFKSKPGFEVATFPAFQKTQLKINPNKAPFGDKAIRKALRQAINREKLVPDVFGDIASVSKSLLPAGMLPDGMAKDAYTYDAAPLKAAVAKLPDDKKKLELGYAQFNVNDARLAEAIAAALKDSGLDVVVKPLTTAVVFDLRNTPDVAPNLLLETANPDASHPDTWARIFYNTEGFLNYVRGGVKAADAEMDLGLSSVDTPTMQGHYAKAGDLLFDDATFVTLCDVKAVYLVRKGTTGFGSTAAAPLSLNMTGVTDAGK
jgi:peptide/nickel transport system substrate-binding protein